MHRACQNNIDEIQWDDGGVARGKVRPVPARGPGRWHKLPTEEDREYADRRGADVALPLSRLLVRGRRNDPPVSRDVNHHSLILSRF